MPGAAVTIGGSILGYILLDSAIRKLGKDPQIPLNRLNRQQAFVESEAIGVLSEAETIGRTQERIKRSGGFDPDVLNAFAALIGGAPLGGNQLGSTDLALSEPSEIAAALNFQSGDPTLAERVAAGSRLPIRPLANAFGIV